MTALLDAVIAILVALVLNAIVLSRIRAYLPPEEAPFLRRMYLSTVSLRYLLAFFLNANAGNVSFTDAFWGDSSTYDYRGQLLALVWKGEILANPLEHWVSGQGFIYFVAAIYWAFGQNQLMVQLINGVIGAATMLVVYAIARDLFGAEPARWSAVCMSFFPQMIFWSAAMYKDPAVMLSIAVSIYAVLRLREQWKVKWLILFLAAVLALMSLRFYVFYFVALATLGTFWLSQAHRTLGSLIGYGALLAAFLGAFSFAAEREVVDQHLSYFQLERVQIGRLDQARSGQSGFSVETDVSTTSGALRAIPVGVVYLLLAPFPWSVTGLRQALTMPEMLVWYTLLPALWRGLRYTFINRFRAALPILTFTAALTIAYAIFQGNAGTAYRQRTQITMFYFVFIGVGIVEKQRQRSTNLVKQSAAG